jgi:glycosyltransferase involved in cell wall biosynthesis
MVRNMLHRLSYCLPRYKNGISVLVSCQDDHLTLVECIESFLLLADEIVIVSNGATPETIRVASSLCETYPQKIKYIDDNEIVDLYQNRQLALENSSYRWVMRCDADYVAYSDEDGNRSIRCLRSRILSINCIWPTAIYFTRVSLAMGWDSMYERDQDKGASLKYLPAIEGFGKFEARIYSRSRFLKFCRLGRWEGVPHIKWYRKIKINDVYWFEVTIRSAQALLYRTARTDWRELGDYVRFPTLRDFIRDFYLSRTYPGKSEEEAANEYKKDIMSRIKPYDESRYPPLPQRIKAKGDN